LTFNQSNLLEIEEEVKKYKSSQLLIVSKNQTQETIMELLDQGYFFFGENRVQEASNKFNENIKSNYQDINLHLIGPLQSNKTSLALKTFDTIQTLDRKKIVKAIYDEINKLGKVRTKEFYIQVNIGKEDQKSGVMPENIFDIYNYSKNLNLNIVGLMCIPPNDENPKFYFEEMKKIKNKIDIDLKLSMGMSQDYLEALQCGSNLIRVGSKIFT
tara:strand:+ start:762 stop:1403 length:642 start_codon:yes stop_codon:yes gene_type:complete